MNIFKCIVVYSRAFQNIFLNKKNCLHENVPWPVELLLNVTSCPIYHKYVVPSNNLKLLSQAKYFSIYDKLIKSMVLLKHKYNLLLLLYIISSLFRCAINRNTELGKYFLILFKKSEISYLEMGTIHKLWIRFKAFWAVPDLSIIVP